jgi:glycosyltransferase involved in cell wall biosynthesis
MISIFNKIPIKTQIDCSIWPWTNQFNSVIKLNRYPKISIIIPTFNQGYFIEETIRSIILQQYPNLELIIIDAGSNDQTKEIVKYYAEWVDVFISEPDHGQSDAINKGWSLANGEITNWVNSDDYLAPNTLYHVAKIYNNQNSDKLIAGNVLNFDSNNRNINNLLVQKNIDFKSILNFWTNNSSWHQPGIFFPMNIIKKYGNLNLAYHYSMDFDLLCKILVHCKVVYTDEILVYFRIHSNSKGVSSPEKTIHEKFIIHLKYMNNKENIFYYCSLLFWIIKIILSPNIKIISKLIIFNSTLHFIKNKIK